MEKNENPKKKIVKHNDWVRVGGGLTFIGTTVDGVPNGYGTIGDPRDGMPQEEGYYVNGELVDGYIYDTIRGTKTRVGSSNVSTRWDSNFRSDSYSDEMTDEEYRDMMHDRL